MPLANKHLEKAERLLQKGKLEPALEEYLLAWHEEPDNDAIVYTVADLYQKLNRGSESKECYVFLFDKAVEKADGPKVMELVRKMQVIGVLEPQRLITAARLLEKQRPDLASEQYRKASEIAGGKDPDLNLQCLQGMARLQSGSLDVHKKLASAAAKLGNKPVAIGAYRRLAELYAPIGKWKEAVDALEQVCVLAPKDLAAQIALAKAYLKANHHENVVKMWRDIADATDDREMMSLLAQSYLLSQNPEKAEALYWKLLDGAPESGAALLEIAKQYLTQDNPAALLRLVKGVDEASRGPQPRKDLIVLAEKLAQLEHNNTGVMEALSRLLDRLHLDGPLASLLNNLFDVYFVSGEYAKAADVLERLIAVDPYNPESTSKLQRLEGKADPAIVRELGSRLGITTAPAAADYGQSVDGGEIISPAAQAAQGPDSGSNPLKDLMLQAEIFFQYGMQPKARERLERIAKLFPGEDTRNEELAQLFEKAGIAGTRPVAGAPATAAPAPTAEENRDFRADLKKVSEISRDLSRQGTVKAVLFTAVNNIGRHWQVSRCVVGLATPNRPPSMAMEYIAQGVGASDAAKLSRLVMGLQQASAGKNFPLVAENVAESPQMAALQDTLSALQVDSLVAIPLRDGDQEIGVLVLQQCGQRRSWKGNDLAALEALAEQIVLAVANVRLRNLMKALAVTDEHSGLLHRESYITCLLSEGERMRTQKTPLSAALLYFSRPGAPRPVDGRNEEAKKDKGMEEFMQKFSSSVMSQLRQNDMAVKYASNTLALILPGATGKDAVSVMEKMRRLAVTSAGAVPAVGEAPHMAAGVAEAIRETVMETPDRVTELINRLDAALDAAHAAGSTAVKLADPPVMPQ